MHFTSAKGILSSDNGMNLYRGCDHGCIYCDSRSVCYQINHIFEDIEVKENALELLERALKSKRNKCMIATGSMSDPYNHCEQKLKLTRRCLELIDRYGFGVAPLTKSATILRDLDLLDSINKKAKTVVQMTLTTYDDSLCRILEPNVSLTSERFEALMRFKECRIPTVVWLCPILPYINDTEQNLIGLLEMCEKASVKGIVTFGMGLTLREGNREYFYQALDRHFPGLKARYIEEYGNSYEIPSPNLTTLNKTLHQFCREHSIMDTPEQCFGYIREFPEKCTQQSFLDLL